MHHIHDLHLVGFVITFTFTLGKNTTKMCPYYKGNYDHIVETTSGWIFKHINVHVHRGYKYNTNVPVIKEIMF